MDVREKDGAINYANIANEARKSVLGMIHHAGTSHAGSNLSCIDILTVLFEHMDLKKDELIISKGWVAASLYHFLAEKGVIPKEDLARFCQPGEEKYIGLIEPQGLFGLRFAGGSMGYGLPAGVGYALSRRQQNKKNSTIYVLMSDGEQAIGTTHESALIAAHHGLSNLVVIIDKNGFQAMGKTKDTLHIRRLGGIWFDWGWDVQYVNGHDYEEMAKVITRNRSKQPLVIIANTIKGKGVSFMEGLNSWHYLHVEDADYQKAMLELS